MNKGAMTLLAGHRGSGGSAGANSTSFTANTNTSKTRVASSPAAGVGHYAAGVARAGRVFNKVAHRRLAISRTPHKMFSTTVYFVNMIDGLSHDHHHVLYCFLLVDVAEPINVHDLALLSGIYHGETQDGNDAMLTALDKTSAICLELEAKNILTCKPDPFNSKLKDNFFVLKDIHIAIEDHFKANIHLQNPTGISLLVALPLNFVDADDMDLDQNESGLTILQYIISLSKSKFWERRIMTNGYLVRFFYGKYADLAGRTNPENQTALSIMASLTSFEEAVAFIYEAFPEAVKVADKNGRTALSHAAEHGFTEIVQFLYDKNPEAAGQADCLGRYPLHYAAINGHVKTAHFLLEMVPEVANKPDPVTGQITLSFACTSCERPALVKYMLSKFPDACKSRDLKGMTPLFHAAARGNLNVVQRLVEADPEGIRATDLKNRTPLFIAVKHGRLEVAKYLHTLWPESIYLKDCNGRTVLSYAATSGSIETTCFIYELHRDAIITTDSAGRSPLFWSTKRKGTKDLVSFLHGCYPMLIKGRDQTTGHTPLMSAILRKAPLDLVQFVHGLDEEAVKMIDYDGRSCFSRAVEIGDLELINYIFKLYQEAVKIEDKNGHLPLWFAVSAGNIELADYLYSIHPAALLAQDRNDGGKTLMILAAEKGYLDLIKFFYGRNVEILKQRDSAGRSPLRQALVNGNVSIVKFFCNVSKLLAQETDTRGRNLLTLALEYRGMDYNFIKFLYDKWPEALEMPDKEGQIAYLLAESFTLASSVKQLLEEAVKTRDRYGGTPFYRAIGRGHIEVARSLLDLYPEALQIPNRTGHSVFFVAVQQGLLDTFQFLYELDPECIKVQDHSGKTLLYVASEEGHLETVKYLYDRYPEALEIPDRTDRTPKVIASQNGFYSIVDYFKKMTDPPVEEISDPLAASSFSATATSTLMTN